MARKTLLLVDGDPRSARVMEVSLRKAGYRVVIAADGVEAQHALDHERPDLVLCDTILPAPPGDDPQAARDGFALCRAMKAQPATADVPFMFLSSSAELDDKIRGLELGVEDYLTRPIYVRELVTRVQLILARKQRETFSGARASFSGALDDLGLVDLLTTIDLGRKTGTLDITSDTASGWMTFRDGRVVHSEAGALRGEAAVYRMLRWSHGHFAVLFGLEAFRDRGDEETVTLPTPALLMEGMRRLDESQRFDGDFPDDGAVYEATPSQLRVELDDDDRALLAMLDGVRTLREVLNDGPLEDLTALEHLARLQRDGVIRRHVSNPIRPSDPSLTTLVPPALNDPMGDVDDATQAAQARAVGDVAVLDSSGQAAGVRGMVAASESTYGMEPSARGVASAEPYDGARTPSSPGLPTAGRHDESNMAKNKNRRAKDKRDSTPGAPARTGTTGEQRAAGEAAEKPVRVESNVIPFPRTPEERDATRATIRAGSMTPEEMRALSDEVRAARADRERETIPPESERPAAETSSEAPEAKTESLAPESSPSESISPMLSLPEVKAEVVAPEAKAEPVTEAKPDAKTDVKTDAKTDAKPSEKPAAKADAKPAAKDEARRSKIDIVVPAKDDIKRDRKESLSTHLSDEARAFFSEAALASAYKTDHDTFEDLAPASEDHPHDMARSKRWMTVTGLLLAGVLVVVVSFSLYHRMGVQETQLNTDTLHTTNTAAPEPAPVAQTPTPAAEPAPAPVAEPAPAPSTEAAPVAVAPTPAEPAPSMAAAEPTPSAAPAEPAPSAAPAEPAPSVAAVAPAPAAEPAPSVAPVAEPAPTPAAPAANAQQLLAAARATRGTLASRMTAWSAYFDAAPTDDRAMATLATSLAEQSHNREAETVAQRAVTANASNAQAWFVLAYTRGQLNNREGSREARTRCIALGGRWAAECRAIP